MMTSVGEKFDFDIVALRDDLDSGVDGLQNGSVPFTPKMQSPSTKMRQEEKSTDAQKFVFDIRALRDDPNSGMHGLVNGLYTSLSEWTSHIGGPVPVAPRMLSFSTKMQRQEKSADAKEAARCERRCTLRVQGEATLKRGRHRRSVQRGTSETFEVVPRRWSPNKSSVAKETAPEGEDASSEQVVALGGPSMESLSAGSSRTGRTTVLRRPANFVGRHGSRNGGAGNSMASLEETQGSTEAAAEDGDISAEQVMTPEGSERGHPRRLAPVSRKCITRVMASYRRPTARRAVRSSTKAHPLQEALACDGHASDDELRSQCAEGTGVPSLSTTASTPSSRSGSKEGPPTGQAVPDKPPRKNRCCRQCQQFFPGFGDDDVCPKFDVCPMCRRKSSLETRIQQCKVCQVVYYHGFLPACEDCTPAKQTDGRIARRRNTVL